MKVYLAMRHVPYEFDEVISVHATLEGAENAVRTVARLVGSGFKGCKEQRVDGSIYIGSSGGPYLDVEEREVE